VGPHSISTLRGASATPQRTSVDTPVEFGATGPQASRAPSPSTPGGREGRRRSVRSRAST
jgi:hypothetical protein